MYLECEGTLWVDDVELRRVGSPTAITAQPIAKDREEKKLKKLVVIKPLPYTVDSSLQRQRVENSSFEQELTSWKKIGWEGGACSVDIFVTKKDAVDGSNSLLLVSNSEENMGGVIQKVKVIPGRTYDFQFYLKIKDMQAQTTESVTVFYKMKGKYKFLEAGITRGSRPWQKWIKELSITVPEDVTTIDIGFLMYRTSGKIWIDKISLVDTKIRQKAIVTVAGPKVKVFDLKQTEKLLAKEGKKGKRYDELSTEESERIEKSIAPPPLNEVTCSNFGIIYGLFTNPGSNWWFSRPGEERVGPESKKKDVQIMQEGQQVVYAREDIPPRYGKKRGHWNIQGVPDKDIIVKNIAAGQTYTYSENPTKKTEYTVHRRSGKFTFGAPQSGEDVIELAYTYWKLSPDPRATRRIQESYRRDLEELYCKNYQENSIGRLSESQIKEIKDLGMDIVVRNHNIIDALIKGQKAKVEGKEIATIDDAVKYYEDTIPKLKGQVKEYILGGELPYSIKKEHYADIYKASVGKSIYGKALDRYMEVVKPIAETIKRIDPDVILTGFTAGHFDFLSWKYCLDKGMAEFIDNIGTDQYGYGSYTTHPEGADTVSVRHKFYFDGTPMTYPGLLEKACGDYYRKWDVYAYEKQFYAMKKWFDSYKPGLGISNCEWGWDFSEDGGWGGTGPKYCAAPVPGPQEGRDQWNRLLKQDDWKEQWRIYNQAVMTARHGLLWADATRRYGIRGIMALNCLHEYWYYGMGLVNPWGERRMGYYAYQTINRLLYDTDKLKELEYNCSHGEEIQVKTYARDNGEMLVIIWAPYARFNMDLVLNAGEYKYPVKIDLFDWENRMPFEHEITKKGEVIIRGLDIGPEPCIVRLVK